MQGKIVLVTGATNGIGKVTAQELANKGATVVIVGRNRAKTEETLNDIKAQSKNNNVDMLLGDLSSMADVRRIAEEFKRKYNRLDVLVNNAGAVFVQRQETVDGYEMTFALNHLSYFLLTNLLLDVIKASAPARIVNVSSEAHMTGPLKFDDLQNKNNYGGMGGFGPYGQSKLANVMFTYELARRLQGTNVTANVLHPGFVASGFGKNNTGWMRFVMRILHNFAISEADGAKTMIYLASSPEVEGVTGKYWDKSKPVKSSTVSYDEAAQRRLWEISEQLTGLTTGAAV
jgi:NAD(P)-dependent dehydrogenase (short-subunit alcohol dehydrogenase family)